MVNLREQPLRKFSRRAMFIAAHHSFQRVIAKGFTGGILRLHDSIGIEQETVACFERQFTNWVAGIGQNPKKQAVALNRLQEALSPAEQRRMPGGGVQGRARLRIQPQIGG